MDGVFTVDEAASIMNCKRRTVYDLIADGWLVRPQGKSKQETGGRVTKESLYKFVIVDRLSHLSVKALKRFKKHRKLFEKSECKNEEAKHLFKYEGTGNDHPSPYPLPQGEGEHNSPPKRCRHHDFAADHQFSFGLRARQLAPNDPSMQDDLVQVMSAAVLEYDHPASSEYLLELATNRAKNYLEYEACRGMISLDDARHVSSKYEEKIASLHAFIDTLMKRGVPLKWIEEAIGWRLEAA